MKLIAPEGYEHFRCAAGACRHTCCAGWEIDIDEASLARYRAMPGALGQKLRQSIMQAADGSHSFRLAEEERCPFLRADGLCELICTLGEGSLCQVCADHPRFRHFLTDRTELGLGLCCEAAARLMLGAPEPFRLVVLADDGGPETPTPREGAFLRWRDAMLDTAREAGLAIDRRVSRLAALGGVDALPEVEDMARFCMGLEQMDPAWTALLERLLAAPAEGALPALLAAPMERLLCCLLYRHLPDALEDGMPRAHLALALCLWRLLRALALATGTDSLDALCELARLCSAEIEYSQENLDALAAWLDGRA